MVRESMYTIFLFAKYGLLLLLLHYVVVGLDESDVDAVGASNLSDDVVVSAYDVFFSCYTGVVDGYDTLLMEGEFLLMEFYCCFSCYC